MTDGVSESVYQAYFAALSAWDPELAETLRTLHERGNLDTEARLLAVFEQAAAEE